MFQLLHHHSCNYPFTGKVKCHGSNFSVHIFFSWSIEAYKGQFSLYMIKYQQYIDDLVSWYITPLFFPNNVLSLTIGNLVTHYLYTKI
jgi:hypothetical protein